MTWKDVEILTSRKNMKQRDLALMIIALCSVSPKFGRTSLQKVGYFTSQKLRQDLGHQAYFYGPFSQELERDVEDLVLAGLVEEIEHSLGNRTGARDGKQYEYKLTSQGKARVTELRKAYPEEVQALTTFVDRLRSAAGGFDQRVLSAAAKTHFIAVRERRPVKSSEIQELGLQFGWQLQRNQVNRVIRVLEELGLVKQT